MVYFSYSERLELFSGEGRGGREGGKRGGGGSAEKGLISSCALYPAREKIYLL
jgi:hypothetical protein